jgi:hypothetical protein
VADEDDKFTPDGAGEPEIHIIITPLDEDDGRGRGPRRKPATPYGPMARNTFDDDFIKPGKPEITFHDLGTRLRSVPGAAPALGPDLYNRVRQVTDTETPSFSEDGPAWNEYVEIQVDGLCQNFDRVGLDNPDNTTPLGLQAEVPAAVQQALDQAILGSRQRHADDPAWRPADRLDPLGTTKANRSNRVLPNCLPIPHKCFGPDNPHAGGILVDLVLTSTTDATKTKVLPLSEIPRFAVQFVGDTSHGGNSLRPAAHPAQVIDNDRWKKRKVGNAEKEALESWNPVNVEGGEAQESGYMDLKGLGLGACHVRIDSRLFYESFDTKDTAQYKVTTDPFFEGAAVAFKLNTRKAARIYLKPRWLALVPKRRWQEVGDFAYKTNLHDWSNPSIGERPFSKIGLRLGGLTFVETLGLDISGGGIYDPDLSSAIDPTVAGGVGIHAYQSYGTGTVQYDFTGYSASMTPIFPLIGWTSDIGGASFGKETGFVKVGPGLVINAIVTDPGVPNEATALCLLLPSVQGTGGFNRMAFPYTLSPAIVGRMPVYCRPYSFGWQSTFDYMGQIPTYAERKGTQAFFRWNANRFFRPNEDEQARENAFIKRRPSWNAREVVILAQDKPFQISSLSSIIGQSSPCVTSLPGGVVFAVLPFGVFDTMHGADVAVMSALRACILSVPGHTPQAGSPVNWLPAYLDNVDYSAQGHDSSGSSTLSKLDFDLFPSRSEPAHQLCGIIFQENKAHYIWRIAARDNYLPDGERDQAFVN